MEDVRINAKAQWSKDAKVLLFADSNALTPALSRFTGEEATATVPVETSKGIASHPIASRLSNCAILHRPKPANRTPWPGKRIQNTDPGGQKWEIDKLCQMMLTLEGPVQKAAAVIDGAFNQQPKSGNPSGG
jgi:hypothetical protein